MTSDFEKRARKFFDCRFRTADTKLRLKAMNALAAEFAVVAKEARQIEAERDTWRTEMAKVTGLGIDATATETADQYVDTVNKYVTLKAE
ncbi:MAG: hypothetical protein ABIH23_14435, partial [bacterium]